MMIGCRLCPTAYLFRRYRDRIDLRIKVPQLAILFPLQNYGITDNVYLKFLMILIIIGVSVIPILISHKKNGCLYTSQKCLLEQKY